MSNLWVSGNICHHEREENVVRRNRCECENELGEREERCECEEGLTRFGRRVCPESGISPIAKFIRENFRGARITITLVGDDEEFTGEVVDGFDNVIALKCKNVITFINAFFIATFV